MHWLFSQAEIDLHTGPGSQNGFDNSGKRGEIHWVEPNYDQNNPDTKQNLERTLVILDKIAGKSYSSHIDVS